MKKFIVLIMILLCLLVSCKHKETAISETSKTENSVIEGKEIDMDFANQITPFLWHDHKNGSASVTLYVNEKYKKELFQTRKEDGFVGSGYDWEALAQVVIQEIAPDLQQTVYFDSENGMFCAYSSDLADLMRFAIVLKETCEDDALISDVFSRAVPQKPISDEDMESVLDQIMNRDRNNK